MRRSRSTRKGGPTTARLAVRKPAAQSLRRPEMIKVCGLMPVMWFSRRAWRRQWAGDDESGADEEGDGTSGGETAAVELEGLNE